MTSSSNSEGFIDKYGGLSPKNMLDRQIMDARWTGSFAAYGVIHDFVLPQVSITSKSPAEIFRLPLSEQDAQTLILASQQTTLGKDTETVDDDAVRKTWQIEPEATQFNNKRWPDCVDRVVALVTEKLGVPHGPHLVRAEFHTMLIEEPGSMLKPHWKTKAAPGTFATLMICLPSVHSGGDICLRHGSKRLRFSSAESIDATFMAWYTDVSQEVEPVTTGYRWVLVYNLITKVDSWEFSADLLTTRVTELAQALETWQEQDSDLEVYPYLLDHKYTDENLNLRQLKGEDFHRVHNVAQSCAVHGGFHAFLANIERCETDFQQDDEEHEELLAERTQLYLTCVVDLEGSKLSPDGRPTVIDHEVHGWDWYDDRTPDMQSGGGYRNYELAENKRFYRDSVIVILPIPKIWTFLLGNKWSAASFEDLMVRLRARPATQQPSAEMILRQMCDDMIRISSQPRDRLEFNLDHCLGSAAVSAIFLGDMRLFRALAEKVHSSFDPLTYSKLGELIDLETCSDEDRNALIYACKNNGKLGTTLKNLGRVQHGHQGQDAVRNITNRRHVDAIKIACISATHNPSWDDAKTLIEIIEHSEHDDLHSFILYQTIRALIDHFLHVMSFSIPCLIEVLAALQTPGKASRYLKALAHRLLVNVVSNLDIHTYTSHPGQQHEKFDTLDAQPFASFYNCISTSQPGCIETFLARITAQADEIDASYCLKFLRHLLNAVMPSDTVKACIASLLTAYVVKSVKHEPERPQDWSRVEDVHDCYDSGCGPCRRMDAFLQDPVTESIRYSDGICCWASKSGDNYSFLQMTHANNAIVLKKTLAGWQSKHREWEDRCTQASEDIQAELPMDKLQACLADRYDEIMGLWAVKIEHRGRCQTKLTTSKKRPHSEV